MVISSTVSEWNSPTIPPGVCGQKISQKLLIILYGYLNYLLTNVSLIWNPVTSDMCAYHTHICVVLGVKTSPNKIPRWCYFGVYIIIACSSLIALSHLSSLFYHHALYSTLWLLVTWAMNHCPDQNMLLLLWTISCTCGVGGLDQGRSHRS